jgi:serine/threonine protein kinase
MAEPDLDRFLKTAVESGLVGEVAARDALVRLTRDRADRTATAEELAAFLVQERQLTSFQARKLLTGTWRGLVLGPYRILRPIAKGGSSQVYLAEHGSPPRRLALKVLPPRRDMDIQAAIERFRREFDVGRRLSHPRIAQVVELGREDGVVYLAQEYVPGQNLEETIRRDGPWPAELSVRFLVRVLDGLAALHASGVIHRDLKPSNVMVAPNGEPMILDLGSALIEGQPPPARPEGAIVGTLDYLSPEQINHPDRIDVRADLFSLGRTWEFALRGRPPFDDGLDAVNKIYRIMFDPPRPIPSLPKPLAEILERLLAKDPSERFVNCGELQTAMNRWLRTLRVPPPDAS